MTPLESALAELERLADIWRREATRLEMAGHSEIEAHIRVCANDLLRVTRAIRAESLRSENAGGSPPSPPCVTGRASSDARPLSGGAKEKGGHAEARRQGD